MQTDLAEDMDSTGSHALNKKTEDPLLCAQSLEAVVAGQ
jgi:hypothetical protein